MSLRPGANSPLDRTDLRLELSWATTEGVDADLSALLCAGRRVRGDDDFVVHSRPRHPTGAVRLQPRTGSGSSGLLGAPAVTGVLAVDLDEIEADVDLLAVAAALDAAPGVGFGVLSAAGLTLTVRAGADGEALVVVPLAGLSTQRALVVVELYRRGDAWKVRAVAQGYDDGLAGLARDFGVEVDDEPSEPEARPDVPALARTGPAWDWKDPPVPDGYRS